MSRRKVAIRVPATTANLGPGFDCLGMALDFHNTVVVDLAEETGIQVSGEGSQHLPRSNDNLVYKAFAALFDHVGQPAPRVLLSCHNDIPLSRGLGSSAAAIVGGLMAANAMTDKPLPTQHLLELGASLEGHPDNIAPAILGGCQVVVAEGARIIATPIPLPPGLRAVLFIPDFAMPTAESRALLPDPVRRQEAVFNLGRTALLVAALATGKLEHLKVATQDTLHQPARSKLFPAMEVIFQAALEAGALGVFLSGGGPTVLALAGEKEEEIAKAMLQAGARLGVGGRTRLARPSMAGAEEIVAPE